MKVIERIYKEQAQWYKMLANMHNEDLNEIERTPNLGPSSRLYSIASTKRDEALREAEKLNSRLVSLLQV